MARPFVLLHFPRNLSFVLPCTAHSSSSFASRLLSRAELNLLTHMAPLPPTSAPNFSRTLFKNAPSPSFFSLAFRRVPFPLSFFSFPRPRRYPFTSSQHLFFPILFTVPILSVPLSSRSAPRPILETIILYRPGGGSRRSRTREKLFSATSRERARKKRRAAFSEERLADRNPACGGNL